MDMLADLQTDTVNVGHEGTENFHENEKNINDFDQGPQTVSNASHRDLKLPNSRHMCRHGKVSRHQHKPDADPPKIPPQRIVLREKVWLPSGTSTAWAIARLKEVYSSGEIHARSML